MINMIKDQIKKLETIVAYNELIMDKVDHDQSNAKGLITFLDESEGVEVWNPFYDTTMRVEVDPIKEYGLDKIGEMFVQYNKLNKIEE